MTNQQRTPLQRLTLGLGALLLMATWLFLVPWLLWHLGGNPLPDQLPTFSQVLDVVTTPDDGTVFRAALTIAGWVGWASYAAPLILEILARLSGIRPPRVTGLRMQQRHAAALVTAVTALLSVAGGATAHATPAPTPTTAGSTQTGTEAPTRHAPTADRGDRQMTITESVDEDGRATMRVTFERVEVHPGDTLWDLAEEHLGEGSRYPEIVKATRHITQADGRKLVNPDLIYPGWRMSIPTPAGTHLTKPRPAPTKPANPPATPAPQTQQSTPQDSTRTQTPRPSQTSPAAPRASATAPAAPSTTRHSQTPDASTPSTAPTSRTDATEPTRERPTAAPSPTGTAVDDAAAALVPPPGPHAPSPSTTHTRTTPTAQAPTAHAQQEHSAPALPIMATVAGLGSLAAAGLLGVLARQRSRTSRHRRPGQRVVLPTGEAAIAEAQLRTAADPDAAADLDRALRTLAANAADTGTPLPQVRAALLTEEAIELYLTQEDATLPRPFTSLGEAAWTVQRSHINDAFLTAQEAAEYAPPFPALVSLGASTADGGHLMLNLEALGSLALLGDPEIAHEVMTALAIEIVTAAWSDSARITLVGLLPELVDVIGSDRAAYCADIEEALPALQHMAADYRTAHEAAGASSTLDARNRGVLDPMWSPHIVLVSDFLTQHDRDGLQELVEDIPRIAIAAITTGAPVGDWQLHLTRDDEDGPIHAVLEPSGMPLVAQHLSMREYFATLNAITPEQPIQPGPAWTTGLRGDVPALDDVPAAQTEHPSHERQELTAEEDPAPRAHYEDTPQATTPQQSDQHDPAPVLETTTDDDNDDDADRDGDDDVATPTEPTRTGSHTAENTHHTEPTPEHIEHDARPGQVIPLPSTGHPRIRLLGPVEVIGAEGPRPRSPRVATEVLAYLALHPGHNEVAFTEALQPPQDGRTPKPSSVRSRRNQLMHAVRAWLGTTSTGEALVPHVDSEKPAYGPLHEDVIVDWAVWRDLVGEQVEATPTATLVQALRLVEGMPLSGVSDTRWAWAQPAKTEMCAAVGDVAHEVASRCLSEGQARTALWAAEKGLTAEPVNEGLWRAAITAAAAIGDSERTQEIIRRCRHALDDFGDELEEDTMDLIDEVSRRRPATAHA